MSRRTRTALAASGLSLLVPGAGQLYRGDRRRAAILFGAWLALCLAGGAIALAALASIGPLVLVAVLAANVLLLGVRLFAILDAARGAASRLAALVLAAFVALAAAPHVAAGYVALRGYDVLGSVFAEEEPGDVLGSGGLFLPQLLRHPGSLPREVDPPAVRPTRRLPAPAPRPFRGDARPLADSSRVVAGVETELDPPWVTVLLLGSDEGPRQAGDRTDTMIVAAMQRETGRAVLLGVPRNLVGVPVRARWRYHEPLNWLYQYANGRPQLFPGARDPGATALKHAISRLLGIRIDYYALVDLSGFVKMVDALGGVRVHVRERIVDEVTRPAWRETKPRIDVHPGRTYLFTGRTALAYVRSRKASSDYRRMARQRCFLSALASQLDVRSVLRNFGSLADAVETSVRTDVPLDRAPDLVRLAAGVDARLTITETFGADYFAGRRFDGWPYPDVRRIQAAVRDAVLHPERATARGLPSAAGSC